jgi:hypothetical protein
MQIYSTVLIIKTYCLQVTRLHMWRHVPAYTGHLQAMNALSNCHARVAQEVGSKSQTNAVDF